MYHLDRRKVALRLYSMLGSLRKTAMLVNVHFSTISRWMKAPERKTYTRSVLSKSQTIIECLKDTIQSNPFLSIRELTKLLQQTLKVTVSRELVRVAIKRQGLTKKKAKVVGTSKNLSEKTSMFLKNREIFLADNSDIYSIDETSFGRNWPDIRGYSKKGEPLYLQKMKVEGKNISVLACASKSGWVKTKKLYGSFNSQSFADFILSLELDRGSVILLDNVAFHHSKIVKEAFDTKGFKPLYTPPYSPWFNPIELCFSVVKRTFYKTQDIEKSFQNIDTKLFEKFFDKSMRAEERF